MTEIDPGNLSPGEKKLLDIVEEGLESVPPHLPPGFKSANGTAAFPPSVGVPLNGNEGRKAVVTRLVGAGLLHFCHYEKTEDMVYLGIRPVKGKGPTLPWITAEEKQNMTTKTAKTAPETSAPAKPAKAPKPPKVEAPLVPCACGCGGMAKKAFVMHHDGKLASTLHLLISGKGDAGHKQIVKNAFANPHVANSEHFKKLYAKWQASAAAK